MGTDEDLEAAVTVGGKNILSIIMKWRCSLKK